MVLFQQEGRPLPEGMADHQREEVQLFLKARSSKYRAEKDQREAVSFRKGREALRLRADYLQRKDLLCERRERADRMEEPEGEPLLLF